MTQPGSNQPADVVILTASYGGMHDGIARAVDAYLRKGRPEPGGVRVIDFLDTFMPNVSVLAKFGYQQSETFFPSGTGRFEQVSRELPDNPINQALARGVLSDVREHLSRLMPRVVLSVLPTAAAVASELAGELGFVSASLIPDFTASGAWIHPDTNVHFVATPEVRDELVVRGVDWNAITVSGVPVLGWRQRRTPAGAGRSRGNPLGLADRFTACVVPGAASAGDTIETARMISSLGVQVCVVLSESSDRVARHIEVALAESPLAVALDRDVSIGEAFSHADVAVAHPGGDVVPHALASGTPLILYNPIPGEERLNTDFLVNSGTALLGRGPQDASEKVRYLSSHPARLAQLAQDCAGVGRTNGAEMVGERVVALLG